MALRLHEAAHNAVDGVQRAVVFIGDHSRDDGVIWAFPGGDGVWMAGDELEVAAAVLQDEAAAFGDDAGAETVEVGVYEGDCVAVFVGDGEVDGVAVVVGGGAMVVDLGGGFEGVEEFGARGEVGFGC